MRDEIARPRTSSSDLSRQVLVNGDWHRRMPDLSRTACGISLHSQFAVMRPESLEAPLCAVCFTEHELAIADEQQRLMKEATE